jgi:hypothetical protein
LQLFSLSLPLSLLKRWRKQKIVTNDFSIRVNSGRKAGGVLLGQQTMEFANSFCIKKRKIRKKTPAASLSPCLIANASTDAAVLEN